MAHYYSLHSFFLKQSSGNHGDSVLPLLLSLAYLSSLQNRLHSQQDKEKSLKIGLHFFKKYQSHAKVSETQKRYNLGRMLNLLKLNVLSCEVYRDIISNINEKDKPNDCEVKAVYNMSTLLKGSGYSSGKTFNISGPTKAQIERAKTNNVFKAHELVMKHIVIWELINYIQVKKRILNFQDIYKTSVSSFW